MDRSKVVFVVAGSALVIGATFVAGLYSAVRQTAAYRVVWGTLDDAKTLVEELPNLRRTRPIHFLRPARYEGSGVTVNAPAAGAEDLILLSGFIDGDNRVRLITRDGTVINDWPIRVHEIFGDVSHFRQPPMTDWNAIIHGAIATPAGDIVFSFESGGMVRMDRCGAVTWAEPDLITHHSPNWTADGGIVIAGGLHVDKPSGEVPWPFAGPYWEDLVYKFAADGTLLHEQPLTGMLIDNAMQPVVTASSSFSTRVDGEFHLNEVEELSPALAADFPMFEAGDLMLSLRNLNMILVTDAGPKVVKWWKIGPWLRQHDPDFEKGGTITLFDNHSDESQDGSRAGGSRIWRVDPATGEARVLYGGRDGQRLYSPERGTHQSQANGNILITEAQQGRAFEVTPEGAIVWEYVNRYDEGQITWLHDAEVYAPSFFTVADWSCR